MSDAGRYVLFGHPVTHSWSPFIHGLFARQFGHAVDYQLVDVEADDFRKTALEFFADGGRGANVTVPHKLAAAEVANDLTARARRAGAVNTLAIRDGARLLGDNTDGAGLVTDLTANLGVTLRRCNVLILGAGGAVRGVLAPLLAERPGQVMIANRTVRRAEEIAAQFEDLGTVSAGTFQEARRGRWDVVLNATSTSLTGDVVELPGDVIGPETVCYDMAYSRQPTPFQRWAQERGARHSYQGWGMLVEQAAESYLLWHGVRPATAPVLGALATL